MDREITFRLSHGDDLPILEDIRQKAFAPIFASFRNILGNEIYTLAQEPEDKRQSDLLSSMFLPESEWELFAVELSGKIIGFISVQLVEKGANKATIN